jgi:hypothetical protein
MNLQKLHEAVLAVDLANVKAVLKDTHESSRR